MTDPYRTMAPKTIAQQIEEAKAKRDGREDERIAKHNAEFDAAYLKALTADDEKALVVAEVPHVGKCLATFPAQPQHAEFKRHANKPNAALELGPCKTYACHCVIFPEPVKFKELCDKYNVQGFETVALKIFRAMQPQDEEEGKD